MKTPTFLTTLGIPAALFLFSPTCAKGQLIVEDVASIALDEVNQALNYVEYVSTEVNTLNQYYAQLQSLIQQGNPAALAELLGMDQLAQTLDSVGGVYQGVQQLGSSVHGLEQGVLQLGKVNPDAIFDSFKNGYGDLSNLQLRGRTAGGTSFERDPGNYVYQGVIVDSADNYAKSLQDVGERRAALKQEITQTMSALQGATDDATVQKYSTILAAQNAQLAALDQEAAQAGVLAQQTQAAALAQQQAMAQAQAEKSAAEAKEAGLRDLEFYQVDMRAAQFKRQ